MTGSEEGPAGFPFPEPTRLDRGRAQGLLDYLDHFREVAIAGVLGLEERDARSSRLASGWTPLIQEYARLCGHLDIVVELCGGGAGR